MVSNSSSGSVIGIVGSEAIKFTPAGEASARQIIRDIILLSQPTLVVSGRCHLGGIDIWAIEEADKLNAPFKEYPAMRHNWHGYRLRNLQIAKSDIVHCISVDRYPPGYTSMRFDHCYHCKTNSHIKSGGCWTMHKCKLGQLHIVENI